jgi:hypothetical protein
LPGGKLSISERAQQVNDARRVRIAAKVTSSYRAGRVESLTLVSSCEHLKHQLFSRRPVPVDRAVRVDVEKAGSP